LRVVDYNSSDSVSFVARDSGFSSCTDKLLHKAGTVSLFQNVLSASKGFSFFKNSSLLAYLEIMTKQWRPGHLILGHADEVWHEVASSRALRENSQPMDEEIINRSTAKSSKATLIGTASSIEKSGNEVRREHNISIPETPLISNVENLFDDEDTWFIPSTCPPPRADEIDRWQHHIAFRQFGKNLRSAAAALFPNTATSRYKNVHVLMIRWEDEDPKLPVSEEIRKLERVFKNVYHFKTEVWCIPDLDCHAEVNQKILDFKRVGGNCKDDLKIVYYAGHAKLTINRLLSWTRLVVFLTLKRP
jgi:hypothetical protein